jgi:hypothetical protein
MINCQQLSDLIIKPALEDLLLYSEDAVELLLFTCANESQGGTYLKQIKGPALGIFQMEPKTYNDIWQNFIAYRNDIRLRIIHQFGIQSMPSEDRMVYDLRFATAMARLHYERINAPLPSKDDPHSIWDYYKTYYNSSLGRAEQPHAQLLYEQFKA